MMLLDYRWEIALALVTVLLVIILWWLRRLQKELQLMSITNLPRDGLPEHMEAAWEDIGAHGRWLTDLGGMSIKMREQMYEEFLKSLNKPITGIPAAGSPNDVLADLDRWLTEEKLRVTDSPE